MLEKNQWQVTKQVKTSTENVDTNPNGHEAATEITQKKAKGESIFECAV